MPLMPLFFIFSPSVYLVFSVWDLRNVFVAGSWSEGLCGRNGRNRSAFAVSTRKALAKIFAQPSPLHDSAYCSTAMQTTPPSPRPSYALRTRLPTGSCCTTQCLDALAVATGDGSGGGGGVGGGGCDERGKNRPFRRPRFVCAAVVAEWREQRSIIVSFRGKVVFVGCTAVLTSTERILAVGYSPHTYVRFLGFSALAVSIHLACCA